MYAYTVNGQSYTFTACNQALLYQVGLITTRWGNSLDQAHSVPAFVVKRALLLAQSWSDQALAMTG